MGVASTFFCSVWAGPPWIGSLDCSSAPNLKPKEKGGGGKRGEEEQKRGKERGKRRARKGERRGSEGQRKEEWEGEEKEIVEELLR